VVDAARDTIMKRTAAKRRIDIPRFITTHRWQMAMVGALLCIIVLVLVYVWHSYATWSTLRETAESRTQDVKSQVETLTSRKHSIEEVHSTSLSLKDTTDHLCDVSSFVKWQHHMIAHARDAHNYCNQYHQKLSDVNKTLGAIVERSQHELHFAGHLGTFHDNLSKVGAEDYGAAKNIWTKFGDDTSKLHTHASLDAVKQSTIATAKEIAAAYDRLLLAHKDQKRQEFDNSIVEIQKGYSKLGELQNLSVESFSKLVDSLERTTQKI
jgi:hypothetical protein